jgi:hypothetical protein
VPEHEKRQAPGNKTVNVWKKVQVQLRVQHEKESCGSGQGKAGKVREREATHAQIGGAIRLVATDARS